MTRSSTVLDQGCMVPVFSSFLYISANEISGVFSKLSTYRFHVPRMVSPYFLHGFLMTSHDLSVTCGRKVVNSLWSCSISERNTVVNPMP